MKQSDFQKLLSSRHSVRRLSAQAVDAELVEQIVRAGMLAPSAHNRQPWRFVILEQGERRMALISALEEAYVADLLADGMPPDEIEARLHKRNQRLVEAPVLVLLFVCMEEMDDYPDQRRMEAERTMAEQSVALAAGQMLLMAAAFGLGACWICAPLFAPDAVVESLALPKNWIAQGAIILGHPGEIPAARERKALEEVARWL